MLTKDDLAQIAGLLDNRLKPIEYKIDTLSNNTKTVQQDSKKIRTDRNINIKFRDDEYLELRQRVAPTIQLNLFNPL